MARILVVDDEYAIRESIDMFLSEKGHDVKTAGSLEEGISFLNTFLPHVVVLDIRFPEGSGLDVLTRMRTDSIHPKIIMITAFQDMETTVEAIKRGAWDYLHKPLDADELEKAVNDAAKSFAEESKTRSEKMAGPAFTDKEIVGKSRVMKDIFKMIGMLCQNRATALITGETGTGKELVANWIHMSSPWGHRPFVTFDCSAVVDTLLESELFGHEKGAFTGAVESRPGKIETAKDGTLFLDEIGELPLNLQGKLLGFLERHSYTRVGGKKLLQSRCRILAATNRDLEQMVREKRFRDDLYFRLNVVSISLPPLRDRLSDIPDLAEYFIQKSKKELGLRSMTFQDGCMEMLKCHPWTGNVRELENIVVAASVQTRGNVILKETIEALFSKLTTDSSPVITSCSLAEVERQHILHVLDSVSWNKTKASGILQVSLPTLRKKIKMYKLTPSKSQGPSTVFP